MPIRRSFILLISLLIFTSQGCSKNEEKAINFGKFQDGIYTNSYFNLKIPIPETWHVMDDETRIELMQRGLKVVTGDNENLKAALKAADLQSINLVTASEFPMGTPTDSNPTLMILAEKIKHLPGIKRGSDYHYHTRKIIEKSAMKVTFPTEIYEAALNGRSFDVLETNIDTKYMQVFQKQYAAILKDYALIIIITYQNEDGLKTLEGILNTIQI